jgi:hypothetical protein
VTVDFRIVRGRTPEDALTTLLRQETYDTLVPAPDLAPLVDALAKDGPIDPLPAFKRLNAR